MPLFRAGIFAAGIVTIVCLLTVAPVSAADRYYDVDPETAPIDGGAANWSDANWKAASGDTNGLSWAGNDTAIFDSIVGSPSTTTITLGGTETATAVIFNGTGYTLTGGTLSLAGTGTGNWITMNADGTIASALTHLRFKGSAEATISGGGTLGGNRIILGDGDGTTVTVRQTGGAITTSDWMMIGGNNVANSQGRYIMDGGSLAVTNGAYLGWGHASSAGTIEQNGGTLTIRGQGLQLGIGGGSGSYILNGGTLNTIIGNNSSGGSFTFGGGTFQAAGGFTVDTQRVASTTIASGATAFIDTAGHTVTWSSELIGSEAAGLVKSGQGVLQLSGANSYAGNTTVERGTLILGHADALGNGTGTITVTRTVSLVDNATKSSLFLNGFSLSNAIVVGERNPGVGDVGVLNNSAAGTTSVLSGPVSFGGENYIGGNGSIRMDGVVSGGENWKNSYTLYKLGSGTVTLANENNTFEGFYYQVGGVTEVTKLANINETSSLGQPTSATANRILFGFGGQGGGRVLYTGSTASVSDRSFVLQGPAGVDNGIDASGTTGAATLTLNGNLVSTGSALRFSLGGTNAGVNTFAGTLGNGTSLALLKDGSTTWRLTATNTYTGATTVQAGRLIVDGSIANSAVTVQSGATLAGSGTLGGATTIQSGATHAPGNSPGLQTFNSGLTYATGSTLQWELIGNTVDGRGTSFDGVNVSGGTLSIGTGVTSSLVFNTTGSSVIWTNSFWDSDRSWLVFANTNSPTLARTGVFDTIDLSTDSLGSTLASVRSDASFAWNQQGNDVYLTYTAVPEPSTYALLVLAAAALGAHAWRRRRRA